MLLHDAFSWCLFSCLLARIDMIVGPPPPSTPRHKKYPTKGPTAPPRESPQYSPRSGRLRLSLWNGQPPSLQPHDGSARSARRDGGAASLSLTKRRPLQALAGWVGVPLSCSSWRGPGEAVRGAPFHRPLCGVRWGWGLPGQKRRQPPQDQVRLDVGPCPSTASDPCHHLPVGRPGLLCGLSRSWREPSSRGVPRALGALFPVFTVVRVVEEDGPS